MELNSLSKGTKLELLFNPEEDILEKGDVVTIENIGVDLNTMKIHLSFYDDCYLNYVWNENNYRIVGLDFNKILDNE